jgi:hypothetical protein
MEKERVFRLTGTLKKPPRPLLNAMQSVRSQNSDCESVRLQGNTDLEIELPPAAVVDHTRHSSELVKPVPLKLKLSHLSPVLHSSVIPAAASNRACAANVMQMGMWNAQHALPTSIVTGRLRKMRKSSYDHGCCHYLNDEEAQAWRRALSLALSRERHHVGTVTWASSRGFCHVSYR